MAVLLTDGVTEFDFCGHLHLIFLICRRLLLQTDRRRGTFESEVAEISRVK